MYLTQRTNDLLLEMKWVINYDVYISGSSVHKRIWILLLLNFFDNKNVISATFMYLHRYLTVMNSPGDLWRRACEWVKTPLMPVAAGILNCPTSPHKAFNNVLKRSNDFFTTDMPSPWHLHIPCQRCAHAITTSFLLMFVCFIWNCNITTFWIGLPFQL